MINKRIQTKLILITCLFLSSCGGSGGNSIFVGAAQVRIRANPQTIDTGDRTLVQIDISDVHENGILLKVRYPNGLKYVLSSAFLEVDNDEIDISPTVDQEDGINDVYLVFFLPQDIFGNNLQGKLTIELEALDDFEDDAIEVDADVDDPLVNNAAEFDVANPEFEAEDHVNFRVVS